MTWHAISVRPWLKETERKAGKAGGMVKDKEDRATVEQALDPRTRLILFKMLSHNVFSEINGCISTGKEANVYHAVTAGGVDLAVKVYKTSILVFKDRDRYVSGDWQGRGARGAGGVSPPTTPPPFPSDQPRPRVCMSIHPVGGACSDLGSSACSDRPWCPAVAQRVQPQEPAQGRARQIVPAAPSARILNPRFLS